MRNDNAVPEREGEQHMNVPALRNEFQSAVELPTLESIDKRVRAATKPLFDALNAKLSAWGSTVRFELARRIERPDLLADYFASDDTEKRNMATRCLDLLRLQRPGGTQDGCPGLEDGKRQHQSRRLAQGNRSPP